MGGWREPADIQVSDVRGFANINQQSRGDGEQSSARIPLQLGVPWLTSAVLITMELAIAPSGHARGLNFIAGCTVDVGAVHALQRNTCVCECCHRRLAGTRKLSCGYFKSIILVLRELFGDDVRVTISDRVSSAKIVADSIFIIATIDSNANKVIPSAWIHCGSMSCLLRWIFCPRQPPVETAARAAVYVAR